MTFETMPSSTEDVILIPIALECDETSCSVVVPDLKGCFSGGDTPEEAIENAAEAISIWLEDREEEGEPMPELLGINYWRNSGEFPSDTWTWAFARVTKPNFWN